MHLNRVQFFSLLFFDFKSFDRVPLSLCGGRGVEWTQIDSNRLEWIHLSSQASNSISDHRRYIKEFGEFKKVAVKKKKKKNYATVKIGASDHLIGAFNRKFVGLFHRNKIKYSLCLCLFSKNKSKKGEEDARR